MTEIPDPRFVPRRRDLGYLRHRRSDRTTTKVTAGSTPATTPAPPPPPTKVTLIRDGGVAPPASPAPSPRRPPSKPPAAAPSPPRPKVNPAPAADQGLTSAAASDTTLDLSSAAQPSPDSTTSAGGQARASRLPVRRGRRAIPGAIVRLGADLPTVTLTRLQSGVGGLTVGLVGVGAERAALGCVYEIESKPNVRTLRIDAETDPVPKPDQSLWGQFKDNQRIVVDLRQTTQLRRALFYVSTHGEGTGPMVACALVFRAQGADLVECPMDLSGENRTVAIATIYNAFGELVIRSEVEAIDGPVRTAAEAHGFSLPYGGV